MTEDEYQSTHKWYKFSVDLSLTDEMRARLPNDIAFHTLLLHHFDGDIERLIESSRDLLDYFVRTSPDGKEPLERLLGRMAEALVPYSKPMR